MANWKVLVNGHEPEKDFVAQTLRNTYWLRDRIKSEMGVAAWINPVIVFTNASVEPTPPIKGVTIASKEFALRILQRPLVRATDQAIWENRERIREILSASS